MTRSNISSCLIVVSLLYATSTTAVTVHVPSQYPTIQAGINATNAAGDTVLVADGFYTGDGNRDIDYGGREITVRSASGDPELCVIDCQASLEDTHRGFIFQSGEGPGTRLEAVTITNGYIEGGPWPNGGGGILTTNGSSPTIDQVIFLNNTAPIGGGLFTWQDSSPTIANCQFVGNSAWTPTYWGHGGGAFLYNSETDVTNCVFRGNSAGNGGGGLTLQRSPTSIKVSRCEFYDNYADQDGGAFNCHFFDIDNRLELVDCTFARNTAAAGGAVSVADSWCKLTNCTLTENTANEWGGGVNQTFSIVVITNTIIAFSGHGSAVDSYRPEEEVFINCSNLYGNAGGDWVAIAAGQDAIPGNISEDPLFCGDDNPDAPYTLATDSPCSPEQYPCSLMGAWLVGCAAVGVDAPPGGTPTRCALHRPSPNPFNPITTIGFTIDRQQPVDLTVLDLRGRTVTVLTDGVVHPGTHHVTWDGTDTAGRAMPSGTYIARLQARDLIDRQKIVLIR